MSNAVVIDKQCEQDVLRGVPFMIDDNPFERVGHEFLGWSTNKNAVEADIQDDHYEKSGIQNSIDLYAVWKPITLTFTFDPSGGKFQNGQDTIYTMSNIEFETFPAVDPVYLNPTRDGYEFNGWYDKNGGAHIKQWAFYAQDNMDFVAKWTAIGGTPQEDIPQQPDHPETQPEDKKDEETQKVYNVISPEEDSHNKFTIVGDTNPCARKTVLARFSGAKGGLIHQAGQLSTSCNPFVLGVQTFVYRCTQFPGEYYYKMDILPGVDRPKGSKQTVGKPSCPVWQRSGYKFLGWVLRDQNGINIAGQPGLNEATGKEWFYNNNPKQAKPFYVNMRYTHSICLSGCWKQGFAFYAVVKEI